MHQRRRPSFLRRRAGGPAPKGVREGSEPSMPADADPRIRRDPYQAPSFSVVARPVSSGRLVASKLLPQAVRGAGSSDTRSSRPIAVAQLRIAFAPGPAGSPLNAASSSETCRWSGRYLKSRSRRRQAGRQARRSAGRPPRSWPNRSAENMALRPLRKNSVSAASCPTRTLGVAVPGSFCSSQSSDSRIVGTASISAIVLMPPT